MHLPGRFHAAHRADLLKRFPRKGHDNRNHHHVHDHAIEHLRIHHHPGGLGTGEVPTVLSRAMLVTILFMVIEFAGGYIANSLALISDAAHMLTDVGAMFLSFFVYLMTQKPVTLTMSYGYHRAEILGALASGLLIWLIAGVLVYEAIRRLASPPEVHGPIVFVVAGIGLIANLVSMWILYGAKKHNLNVRAAYLHMFADSVGSIGAVAAGAILWWTHWRPIDPIITILSAVLMLAGSWELIREAVGILMESTPAHVPPEKVKQDLRSIPGVQEIHDLHIWTVSSGRVALSVHIVAQENQTSILATAKALLREQYAIIHTTIQVERPDELKGEPCYDCTPKQ